MRGRWFFIRESSGMKWLIVAAKEHRRIGNFYLSPPPPSYRRKEQNQMCANRIGQFTYLLTARSIWYLDCWWSFGNFFFVMVFVDGNRSFDESLIVARNPTTVRGFSSFFFPVSENFIGSRMFAKLMRI